MERNGLRLRVVESKEAESQEASEVEVLKEAYEGLIRAVSHDLRAPLRHLTSFAPLLRESVEALAVQQPGSDADEAREFLGAMEQSARKMGAMLDALLQLSRAARQPMLLQDLELIPVVQSVLAEMEVPQNAVIFSLPEGVPRIHADAAAVHAMCTEIIGNAVKFSPQQLQLRIQISQQGTGNWMLQVQDGGVGFNAQRMATSWPPFQRMHRESDFDGMGCGLSLVHTLAQRQGAKLELYSQSGEGCTARIFWPAA